MLRKVSGLLVALMLLSPPPAFAAETIDTPVTITADATTFSVTVPTTIPITVTADGTTHYLSGIGISNGSSGRIRITAADIIATHPWTLVPYDTDFTAKPVNSKDIAIELANPVRGDILPGQTTTIQYRAKVAPQSTVCTGVEIARVIFTIGWDAVAAPTPITLTVDNRGIWEPVVGATGDVVIPATFTGMDGVTYEVTGIGEGAFAGCESLVSVNIPEGITSIGDSVFSGCTNLGHVTILNSDLKIGSPGWNPQEHKQDDWFGTGAPANCVFTYRGVTYNTLEEFKEAVIKIESETIYEPDLEWGIM